MVIRWGLKILSQGLPVQHHKACLVFEMGKVIGPKNKLLTCGTYILLNSIIGKLQEK